MNILPKKKWHVRTKENVARVLRDEENANIEAEKEQERISKAESEARITLLRNQAASKYHSASAAEQVEHVNLFSSLENKSCNKDASEEKMNEQKNWEIKVGYLKLLGQGSSELATEKPWYQKKVEDLAAIKKRKQKYDPTDLLDPLHEMKKRSKKVDYATPVPEVPETVFVDIDFHDKVVEFSNERRKHRKILSKEKCITKPAKKKKKSKKKKRHKISSSSSHDSENEKAPKKSMQQLREERQRREHAEHIRTQKLLDPNYASKVDSPNHDTLVKPRMKQKYNSQFNPTYVRSNYSRARK